MADYTQVTPGPWEARHYSVYGKDNSWVCDTHIKISDRRFKGDRVHHDWFDMAHRDAQLIADLANAHFKSLRWRVYKDTWDGSGWAAHDGHMNQYFGQTWEEVMEKVLAHIKKEWNR